MINLQYQQHTSKSVNENFFSPIGNKFNKLIVHNCAMMIKKKFKKKMIYSTKFFGSIFLLILLLFNKTIKRSTLQQNCKT